MAIEETGHKETEIPVKNGFAFVDIGIQPIVNWLNGFESIETTGSCEGDKDDKIDKDLWWRLLPLVGFKCKNNEHLIQVLIFVDDFIEKSSPLYGISMRVSRFPEKLELEYCLDFTDRESMEKFTEYLIRKGYN